MKNRDNEKNAPSFKLIWGIMMVAIYLGLSYVLVFSPLLENSTVPFYVRVIMAVVFSTYGVFRAYRIWKK